MIHKSKQKRLIGLALVGFLLASGVAQADSVAFSIDGACVGAVSSQGDALPGGCAAGAKAWEPTTGRGLGDQPAVGALPAGVGYSDPNKPCGAFGWQIYAANGVNTFADQTLLNLSFTTPHSFDVKYHFHDPLVGLLSGDPILQIFFDGIFYPLGTPQAGQPATVDASLSGRLKLVMNGVQQFDIATSFISGTNISTLGASFSKTLLNSALPLNYVLNDLEYAITFDAAQVDTSGIPQNLLGLPQINLQPAGDHAQALPEWRVPEPSGLSLSLFAFALLIAGLPGLARIRAPARSSVTG